MEKLITPKQLSKLHVVLNQSGMKDSKKELVYAVSNHRTVSTKELTNEEVTNLIDYLEDLMGTDKLRRKIYSLAYEAGIIYGDTPDDKKMNSAKLNKFLIERGAVKKEIGKMNKSELLKVVKQFSSILKHTDESIERKQANEALKVMLGELNIGLNGEQ